MEVGPNSSVEAPGSFNVSLRQPCRSFLIIPFIFEGFLVTNFVLFLPLCTLVVFVGCQRWRKQRRCASAEAAQPSDIFTYHMVAMETLAGACFCIGSIIGDSFKVISWVLFYIISCVKNQFLMLTCVEFYLAVVHPILYLSLRSPFGVRIRNASVAWVWFLCVLCGIIGLCDLSMVQNLFFFLVGFVLAVVLFCCISVLWTLRRLAPGQKVKDRADPSKKRAFLNIVTILVVIWLCLIGLLVFLVLDTFLNVDSLCVSTAFMYWFTLPSGLVLPLLFLQRAKELPSLRFGKWWVRFAGAKE